jgi:2-polyprenyl-3-methyl-5-hydroxy-6-metoxy-1,4-benzoquinol methylase
MSRHETMRRRREVIRDSGPWINHSIALNDGLYTEPCDVRARRVGWDDLVLRRIVQTISDLSGGNFTQLRVLDLGALEGLYSVELARQGATVVATDVREEHLAKINFVKDVLKLDNLEVRLDDVRNLSPENYGSFDYTLCLGLLYHLDGDQACDVLKRIASVTTGALILDTHIANWHDADIFHDGQHYYGRYFGEHNVADVAEQKASMTASVGNMRSFWFTRKSLYRALLHAGFSSVQEVHVPNNRGEQYVDRVTLVAHRGRKVELKCCPENNALSLDTWAEEGASLPQPIVYLPDNYPCYKTSFDPKIQVKRVARKLRGPVKRVLGAARRRVTSVVPKGDTKDDRFDKYRHSGAYHWGMLVNDASYRARVSLLIDYVRPDVQCLDLGGGDGAYIEILAPECQSIVGVDADSTGVRLAQDLLAVKGRGNAEIVCSRFESLSKQFPTWLRRFDLVYSMDTIEHLEEPEYLLQACRDLVSQSGTVVIGTPEFISDEEVSPYHFHEYSQDELVELVGRYFQCS